MKYLIKQMVPLFLRKHFHKKRVHQQQVAELRHWTPTDSQFAAFYGAFIHPGETVFDVGANMGNRTKVFRHLGAKSIAFEPQPGCWAILNEVFGGDNDVVLERCALGDLAGEATMYVSDAHTISSLSADWIESVQKSGRFDKYLWDKKITVPVKTLDHYIAIHGKPCFIKIDVEGFESRVIAGLSQAIRHISIEFVPERIDDTYRCIQHLDEIGMQSYRISFWDSMHWQHDRWEDSASIRARLGEIGTDIWGDLFARQAPPDV